MIHVLAARVLLRPSDFAAALDFYERRLGLARFREWGAPPHRGVVFFLGGGYLELGESNPDGASPQPPQGVRLWLQVADADGAWRELTAQEVDVRGRPERKPWGLVEFEIRDPDGLELVVVEVPGDHPLRRRPPGT